MDPATHPHPAPPGKKKPSVYAFLIVLLIIIIAAVAVQAARQRRGLTWSNVGLSPAGALPRCAWPLDKPYVEGQVNVFSGAPGIPAPCFTQAVGAAGSPRDASEVALMLGADAAAIKAACPGPAHLFQGSGTYACRRGGRPPSADLGGADADEKPFAGASILLRGVLRDPANKCHPGHVPVITDGSIEAYLTPTSQSPCGRLNIGDPTPATIQNLRAFEDHLTRICGRRAGWYVVNAMSVCPHAARRAGYAWAMPRERFDYWGDWAEATERENFAGRAGFIGGAAPCIGDGDDGSSDPYGFDNAEAATIGILEGFSPDAPGACQTQWSRAARAEIDALRVAAGM
jgi:hypothetical protein